MVSVPPRLGWAGRSSHSDTIKLFPRACFLVHARRVELVLLVPPGIELPHLVLRLRDIVGQGEVDPLVAVTHVELVSAIVLPPWIQGGSVRPMYC